MFRNGGSGADDLFGGEANDIIDSRNGMNGNDFVDCGEGNNDRAIVDPGDGTTNCDGNVDRQRPGILSIIDLSRRTGAKGPVPLDTNKFWGGSGNDEALVDEDLDKVSNREEINLEDEPLLS